MSPASQSIQYRIATERDEPFLWTALYHGIHVPAGQAAPAPEIVRRPELARYVQGWSAAREPGVIAEIASDGPIGAAWLRLLRGDCPGYGYVDDDTPELGIAILPGWRGRGIGTILLRQLLNSARARFPRISLSVSASNPARHLYERQGFREVNSSGDSITMMLVLEP